MKIMIFDNVYDAGANVTSPCRECTLSRDPICPKIPASLCIELGGGFRPSNTKIFTL